MKKTTLAIAAAMILATPATPTNAGMFTGLAVGDARFYHRLAQCETGANYAHSTRSYTSGFGIARGVWQRYSNSSSANRYSPRQQAIVVDRIAFLGHTENGVFHPPVGPWGFGAIRTQNCMQLQNFICKNKRPMIKRWQNRCK
jgi:hypothetical protein